MGDSGKAQTQTTKNWEKELEGLPSHKIYEHFNENDDTGNKYDKECKINGTDSINCTEFENICKKFANSLEDILCKKHGNDTINYCILLKYWVYEQIKQKCGNNNKNIKAVFLTEKLKTKCSIPLKMSVM
ncbi:CYIR protein [Plasmodium cynomolgi strain B]|uniref:CYIR protein n=1 Tax=Plasmodium cynomolgi (strain B) TaxID=1120755 RepID=K6UZZ5_PLACD|nr:CYIR protein [Plasmodium cynomolgi strain B]GAB69574.1 CYIR protein [Plasmodium cynomolgi strain B]